MKKEIRFQGNVAAVLKFVSHFSYVEFLSQI